MRAGIFVLLLAMPAAQAGPILDYIRNYDLNDYALGVAYSVSESPYQGVDSSGFAYPYLTSFRHNAFTNDWLILTGGDAGVRWVNDAGWVLGAVVDKPINENTAALAAEAALKGATPLSKNAHRVETARAAVKRAILAATS